MAATPCPRDLFSRRVPISLSGRGLVGVTRENDDQVPVAG
jgi:hypothetical protein